MDCLNQNLLEHRCEPHVKISPLPLKVIYFPNQSDANCILTFLFFFLLYFLKDQKFIDMYDVEMYIIETVLKSETFYAKILTVFS